MAILEMIFFGLAATEPESDNHRTSQGNIPGSESCSVPNAALLKTTS